MVGDARVGPRGAEREQGLVEGRAALRLETLAGARVDGTGVLILVSQVTRDQRKNLSDARQKLAELVLRALERPKKRRPTKPSRGAKRARLSDKKKVAEKKRERRGREE